ncbi:ketoacyl-ACP synthase III [Coraliomargarita akajimensis]|uniref:Beta-ketoacyl-acyl-carrier-protein synthase III n=1 Tax=Coraliomargarita akajimensis (strain DSM 45221 / IAM 15411 / JCM 23193 / KCTC 12865 / 04OKA010-24) TaxID=583355 RepID=D5EMZ8_CORAD|nr:ketoacyl-ACP synthase III [Coraliomargarita akajimensis]ADE55388.1 Beta-ketoacyl-acyl-carrier-protein synthase III [Coraliomargarita akajimensis DSM 45221]
MPQSSFQGVRISGIVTCVPTTEKCIDDELELFGGNVKQIERLKKTIGLNKRRVVDAGETAADLCEAAARRLLQQQSLEASELDAIICVTQTPDHSQPCNAAVLHGKLGCATKCAAFDVNLGCSGYVYGLWLAHMMCLSGGCERVLLLAGDTISRLVNPRDRSVAPLFGDGGSATLLEPGNQTGTAFFSVETDGAGCGHLMVPAGGARRPSSAETVEELVDEAGNIRCAENLFMDGAEVFNFSVTVEPRAVKELLAYAGLENDAVDYYVFHQANRYILGNIAKRLKLAPEKVPMQTVEQFGNQSSASIPGALCGELAERLLAGDGRQVLLSGFGVGLSWASAVVDLSDIETCELIDYGS